MSCKINSIEQRYRETNPSMADKLTDIAMNAWQSIKDSGVFQKEGLSYVFNAPNTKKRIEQDKVVNTINATQPTPFVKEKEGKVSVNALLLHNEKTSTNSAGRYQYDISTTFSSEKTTNRIFSDKEGSIYPVHLVEVRSHLLPTIQQIPGGYSLEDNWRGLIGGVDSEKHEIWGTALLVGRLFDTSDDFTGKLFDSKPGNTVGRIYISKNVPFLSADSEGININPKGFSDFAKEFSTFEGYKNGIEAALSEEAIHFTILNLTPDNWIDDIYKNLSQPKIEKIKQIYKFTTTGKELEHQISHEYIRMCIQQKHLGNITEKSTRIHLRDIIKKFIKHITTLLSKEGTAKLVIDRFNTFLEKGDVIPYTDEQLYKDMQASIVSKGEELLRKTKQLYASTNTKQDVDQVFKENPELSNIGTPEQYSEYLDTIFPDSKVKDIVYRGSEFEEVTRGFHYYTNNKSEAMMFAKAYISKGGKVVERNPTYVIRKNIMKHIDEKYGKNVFMSVIAEGDENYLNQDVEGNYFFDYPKGYIENAKEILDQADLDIISNSLSLVSLYDVVKIEDDGDLMKPFDDTAYIENIDNYKKVREKLEPFFNREDIGVVKSVLLNIKNPYEGEIVQEDLVNDYDAYKNGHDGALLAHGDHFLVRTDKDQIHELGSKQDIEGFKNFTSDNKIDSKFSPIQISETLQEKYGKEITQEALQSNPDVVFHEAYKNNEGAPVGVYTEKGETFPKFNSLGTSIDEAISRLKKDALNNNIKEDYTITPIENEPIPNQPRLAHNIEQMLDDLATRFQVNWGYDYEMAQRGAIRDGKVLINPNHATFDTPFHEYLHPFINLIKQQGSPFYQLLSNSVMSVTDITGKSVLSETKKNNPNLSGDELIEEAIVEAAGLAAIGRLVETPANKSFLDYLRMFLDNIGKLLGFDFEQHVDLNTPFRTVVNMMLDSNFVYDMRPYAGDANQKLTPDQIDTVLQGLNNDLVTETKYITNEHGIDEEKRKYKNTRTGDIYNGVHEDVVQPYYDKIFPDPIEPTPGMIFQKEAGTALHNIFEQVLHTVFVDTTTHQLKTPILEYFQNPDEAAYNKFTAYLEGKLGNIVHDDIYSEEDPDLLVIEKENASYYYEHINAYLVPLISRAIKDHGAEVKFYSEQRLLDTNKGRAGTTDLLIVGPEKFDIYDWKTINPTKYNTLAGERTELEMLASFKEAAYKIQMREYIRMVKQLTGLELNKAIAVPIGVESFKNPNGHYLLGGIVFGDPRMKKITVGPTGEERRYLLPVMIEGETPENKTINEFINKLEGYIKVYSNMMQSDKDQRKIARELQIDSLRKIIQDLQIDRNHQNILNRIDVLLKQAEEQIALEDDTINIEKLTDIKYELDLYKDVQKYFNITGKPKLTYDLAQKQQLVIFMVDKIIDRTNNYTENAAIKEGIPNILENEMAYTGMKRWFTEMSAITKVKTVAFFDKLKRKYQTKAKQEKVKYYKKLGKAMVTLNGEDIKKFFRKSADGKMQPFLISKYAMKERLQEATEGADYFNMFDLDQEAYARGLENYKNMLRDSLHFKERIESDPSLTQKEIDDKNLQIDEYNDRQETKYENKVAAWEERYSTPFEISGNMVATGVHWAYYKLNPEFEEHWQTEEFKELAKNPKRLELYNVIQDINDEAFKLGLITYRNKFTHFPSILANSQEKVLAGETGVFSMQRFFDDLKASDQDEETITGGKLEINPITGKIDRAIPKLYRNRLGIKKEDGTYDYSKQSFNLAKVFGRYVNHIKEYEARQDLELQASLLMDLESRKSNVLSVNNKAVYSEDAQGNLVKEITEGVNKNTSILETTINRSVYGVTPFSDIKSSVKVFGKEVNGVRVLRKLMAWRSMTSLGLNTTSALVTGIGGNLNMFLEANKNGMYTKKDITNAMTTLTQTSFRETKAMRVLKMLQGIDPIMDDLNEHRINQLSLTKFDQIVTSDNLFFMMRNVDKATQFVSGMAVMNNYMVKEGQLIEISKYVRNLNNFDPEFNRLAQTKQWGELKRLEDKIKVEIEEMKTKESVVSKELAGEDSGITEEMQRELSPILQKYSKQILGNMSRDDVAQYKDTILGQLAGQFRGWMPRLALQRFGGAERDGVTGKLNWGKYLTLTELLNKDLVKTIQSMFGQLNESSYDRILMKYNDLLQTHIDNGGTKDDFIPLSEFKELYINNLRSSLKEILMMSTMSVMIYALGAAWDDDDKLNAAQRYTLLLLNRANNELMFYINPKSATDLLKSPIPLISTLTDIQSFGSHFSKESFNQVQQLITGDEEDDLKKAKPSKYLFKLFPITKEMMNWGALLDDDFRKEFNINLNYR